MHPAAIALAGALVLGSATVGGVVLMTSGPFANQETPAQQEDREPANPTATPSPTPLPRPTPTEGSPVSPASGTPEGTATPQPPSSHPVDRAPLRELIARGVDTSKWQLASDPRLPLRLRIPTGLDCTIRELPPLIVDDPGVTRVELAVSDQRGEQAAPLPSHAWPDQLTLLSLLWLPSPHEPVPFGTAEDAVRDQAEITVLGTDIAIRDQEGLADPRRVVAEANIAIEGGTVHLLGIALPGLDEPRVVNLIGMLQSLELTR